MDLRIGIVSGSKLAILREGDVAGRVLQAVITSPTDVQNLATFQGGEEFNPPNGCSVAIGRCGEAYKVVLGVDDGQTPVMAPGGKRIYSVDAEATQVMVDLRFGPDGSISMLNKNGYGLTMTPDGQWVFHGTKTVFDHPVEMDSTLDVKGAATLESTLHAEGAVTCDSTVTAHTVTGTTDVLAGPSSISGALHHQTSNTVGNPTSIPLN